MTEQIVSFRLGEAEYGLPISTIREIIRFVPITAVPNAPAGFEGIVNLRGVLVPILDLRVRFGLARAEASRESRIVIAERAGGSVGLIVDSVSEVLRIPSDAIDAPPEMAASSADTRAVRGIGKVEDRLVLLLDVESIVGGELAAAA